MYIYICIYIICIYSSIYTYYMLYHILHIFSAAFASPSRHHRETLHIDSTQVIMTGA